MLKRRWRLALILALLLLPLTHPASGQGDEIEPVPPGTPSGEITIVVIDCETRAPITGADVTLENPSHTVNAVTIDGEAVLTVYDWWYSYLITHEDYIPISDVKRFKPGVEYEFCLIPRVRGEWRVFADILRVGGDLYPGGEGWMLVRIRNLEAGYFRIHRIRAYVEGLDKPIADEKYPNPLLLPKDFYIDVNITVKPPSTAPTGRLMTELRMKATFYYDENRWAGPLTAYLNLDFILLKRFRSLRFDVVDYWGLNNVPNVVVVMRRSLPGVEAEHVFTSGNGTVFVKKLSDGVYEMEVYYDSPYDGERYLIRRVRKGLLDLAREEMLKTLVSDVRVSVYTLGNKPLAGAEVSLGMVKALAGEDGQLVFHNVPRGEYPVKVFWRGVEVYSSNASVGLPPSPAIGSPGAEVNARADVGGFTLELLDAYGEELGLNTTIILTGPVSEEKRASERASFNLLPRGVYRLEFRVFNPYLGREVPVASETLSIPQDHGKHEVKLGVFDLVFRFVDAGGEALDIRVVEVEGRVYNVSGGVLTLPRATAGGYRLYAEWMGVSVLDEVVNIPAAVEEGVTVRLSVYDPVILVVGVDGLPLPGGNLTLERMGISRGVELVNGSAVFEDLPDASYVARVRYRGKLVLEAEVERLGGELRLVAAVARLSARVVDQFNNPVEGALVSVEDTQAVSGGDGYAVLGHLPLGEYEAQVEYRGVKAGTVRLNLTGGEAVEITIQLHTLRVEAVDEIGRPLEVSASLYSMGRLIASGSGSAIEFPKLPSGNYQLTLRRGPKEVNKPIALAGDRVETVTFPILLELGGVVLSSQEAMLILLPLVAVMLLVIAGLMVREFIRWLRERE